MGEGGVLVRRLAGFVNMCALNRSTVDNVDMINRLSKTISNSNDCKKQLQQYVTFATYSYIVLMCYFHQ